MTWPCGTCGTTEPGHRIGRAALCVDCDRKAEERRTQRINEEFEARALAKATHPAGKSPRYRVAQQWQQCRCHVPMAAECGVHG